MQPRWESDAEERRRRVLATYRHAVGVSLALGQGCQRRRDLGRRRTLVTHIVMPRSRCSWTGSSRLAFAKAIAAPEGARVGTGFVAAQFLTCALFASIGVAVRAGAR